jgi:hypothetical protein
MEDSEEKEKEAKDILEAAGYTVTKISLSDQLDGLEYDLE